VRMRADAVHEIEAQQGDYAAARSRDAGAEPDEPSEERDRREIENRKIQTRRREEPDGGKSSEGANPKQNQRRLRQRSEPGCDRAAGLIVAGSPLHSGMTAVASISTLARSSMRSLTTTTDIAGKCLPMTSR